MGTGEDPSLIAKINFPCYNSTVSLVHWSALDLLEQDETARDLMDESLVLQETLYKSLVFGFHGIAAVFLQVAWETNNDDDGHESRSCLNIASSTCRKILDKIILTNEHGEPSKSLLDQTGEFGSWLEPALKQLYTALDDKKLQKMENPNQHFHLKYQGLDAQHVCFYNAISRGLSGPLMSFLQCCRESERNTLSMWCFLSAVKGLDYGVSQSLERMTELLDAGVKPNDYRDRTERYQIYLLSAGGGNRLSYWQIFLATVVRRDFPARIGL